MRIVLHLDRYGTIETRTGELCYHSSTLEGTWNHVPVEVVQPGDWVVVTGEGADRVTRVDAYPHPDPHEHCIPKQMIRAWADRLETIEWNLPLDTDGRSIRTLLTEMREAIK